LRDLAVTLVTVGNVVLAMPVNDEMARWRNVLPCGNRLLDRAD
jgi:hypothetical protein